MQCARHAAGIARSAASSSSSLLRFSHHAAPGTAVLRLGGREVAPDGDPADYTTFSLMRILRRRQARVVI